MGIILSEAKEIMLSKIKDFSFEVYEKTDLKEIDNSREGFVKVFSKEKIKNLKKEDYYPGLGQKQGNLTYELEWGTKLLGSIRGGSKYKFGYEEDFNKIKKLILDILDFEDIFDSFYDKDGNLTDKAKKLFQDSEKIKGLKTGRTFIGKLLSIYYPKTFIWIFTDQDHFLKKILSNYSQDNYGLELFLNNNYLLHKIKQELLDLLPNDEKEKVTSNYAFVDFLYFCFPKVQNKEDIIEEEKFEALECEHYQTLIHRNFKKIFNNEYTYFDPEAQNENTGHYDTQEVGIMDFLCIDKKNDLVVIELKRSSTDQTLGQICRYMGWVKENLCKDNQKVKGIIIAESKDIRLTYALKIVPNVEFKTLILGIQIGS